MTCCIHTIFVLRENILFLNEWIQYHLSIGIDKIFLYDNSLSTGRDGSNSTTNKYQINFAEITAHLNDNEVIDILVDILTRYGACVVYNEWSPRDRDGRIAYNQNDCIRKYLHEYGKDSVWTAFIDIDEFIYCKFDLKEVLTDYDKNGIGDVILLQKKFRDRFDCPNIPVTQIVDCIEGIDTRGWAPKHIFKNNHFDGIKRTWNIHNLPTRDCRIVLADIQELRFNHYNVNKWQLEWMKKFYDTKIDIKFNAQCFELYYSYHEKMRKREK